MYATAMAVFCLAAAGTPGLNSFIGEFLIISGAFQTQAWLGAAAIWGVVLGTAYMVWLYYRVAMGKLNPGLAGLRLELNGRELAILAPLAILAFGLGLHPESVLSFMHVSVAQLLALAVSQ
jgi:NADH-quinone oxidoreductase subunit M